MAAMFTWLAVYTLDRFRIKSGMCYVRVQAGACVLELGSESTVADLKQVQLLMVLQPQQVRLRLRQELWLLYSQPYTGISRSETPE